LQARGWALLDREGVLAAATEISSWRHAPSVRHRSRQRVGGYTVRFAASMGRTA